MILNILEHINEEYVNLVFLGLNLFILITLIASFISVRDSKKRWNKMNDYLGDITKTVNSVRYGDLTKKINELDIADSKDLTESLNRMIETLKDREIMINEFQKDLLKQNRILEQVLNSLSDGLLIVDENYMIQRATKRVAKWFDVDGKTLYGKSLHDYVEIPRKKPVHLLDNDEVSIPTQRNLNFCIDSIEINIDDDKEYKWDESVDMVLSAYKEFSPKLYNIAKDFFENNWIDVAPKKGKRSGAFCSSPLVKEHPFIMLNFVGKRHDVLTLAHELGHGCHHQLRRNNGDLNETCRLTSEEIASVFGEMLVFQSMLKKATTKEEKISLLTTKINDMLNTAFRQIAFHFFEKRAHDERKKGELSSQRLSEIWVEEMKASLGDYVKVGDNADYIWAQVGHFFFLPFYVYAYSFADCVVNSLYWVKMENKVENFEDKSLELLSKTAIGDYKDIFKPFGLNPNDKEFWQGGLNLIGYYIKELESAKGYVKNDEIVKIDTANKEIYTLMISLKSIKSISGNLSKIIKDKNINHKNSPNLLCHICKTLKVYNPRISRCTGNNHFRLFFYRQFSYSFIIYHFSIFVYTIRYNFIIYS